MMLRLQPANTVGAISPASQVDLATKDAANNGSDAAYDRHEEKHSGSRPCEIVLGCS